MKTIKAVIGVIILLSIGYAFIFGDKGVEEVEVEQSVIVKDTQSIFDGLKDFSKRQDVRKKVEMVEKQAFLEYRKEVLEKKYEIEIAEIEAELDTVRGELSVS
jgi:nucleoid-associated protein YejK